VKKEFLERDPHPENALEAYERGLVHGLGSGLNSLHEVAQINLLEEEEREEADGTTGEPSDQSGLGGY